MEMRQLLIEVMAKPRELLGVAQLMRFNNLVIFQGERKISGLTFFIAIGAVRPASAMGFW